MKRWSDFTQPGGKAQQSQVIERMPFSLNIGQLYPEAPLCYNPRRIQFTASTQIPNLSPTLASAFEHQDQQFSAAFSAAREAIANHTFSAACIAVTHAGKLVALKSFGKFVYEDDLEGAPPLSRFVQQGGGFDSQVRPDTLFDLASVTKVIATTTMAMILYERGLLELEAPVSGTIPEFLTDDERRHAVTFRMLLAHSSGLPAYEKLFLKARSRDELLQAAFTTPLAADPGTRAEYSDIGFIVLGVALERIAGESLDGFCQREIFGPLGMAKTTFNPPQQLREKIPPTADERGGRNSATAHSTFRNRIVQGEVQDENACVLGGAAAHAGLFSTAEDVARFAQMMLAGGNPILRHETVALFTRREASPSGTSHALGWDTPSAPSQSGKYFGPRSFGHLGYTGTSLWIDPDRQLSITLLTNRTWPDCSNQAIKQVRPRIHDAIVEGINSSSHRRDR
jgi:serine-type D-Ala-D-Ala carboxypeptidase